MEAIDDVVGVSEFEVNPRSVAQSLLRDFPPAQSTMVSQAN